MKCYFVDSIEQLSQHESFTRGVLPYTLAEQAARIMLGGRIEEGRCHSDYNAGIHYEDYYVVKKDLNPYSFVVCGDRLVGYYYFGDSVTVLPLPEDVDQDFRYERSNVTFYYTPKALVSAHIGPDLPKVDDPTAVTCLFIEGLEHLDTALLKPYENIITVYLPDTLRSVDATAFRFKKVVFVHYAGSLEQWCHLAFDSSDSNPCSNGAYLFVEGDKPLPDEVHLVSPETIGAYVFSGANFRSLKIEGSLRAIGAGAFLCGQLETVSLPEGLLTIGEGAFAGCRQLTAINLPEGLLTIGERAFVGCRQLTAIELPEGLLTIGERAFEECQQLTAIELPDGVTLGDKVFCECKALTHVRLPKDLVEVPVGLFYGCSSLRSVQMPRVRHIKAEAFRHCRALTELQLPDVTQIDPYALSATGLVSLSLGDGLTEIAERAFMDADLPLLRLPKGVTKVGGYAFAGCKKLVEVICEGTALVEIAEEAFAYCSSLRSIRLPQGLQIVGNECFSDCDALEEVELPDTLTKLGYAAFSGCSSLQRLVVPEGVTEVAVTNYCSGLRELVLPKGVLEVRLKCVPSTLIVRYGGTIQQWRNVTFYSDDAAIRVLCEDGQA